MKIKDVNDTKISVTGGAGFIGAQLIRRLKNENFTIETALDSFKPSYEGDWCALRQKFLAAFPGIRQGEIESYNYLQNNVLSSGKIIEACKLNKNIKAILFASSSSVYGDEGFDGPCKEICANGMQLKSNYAMTKWINEIQFRTWQQKLKIPIFGLRFFTVFGEWGRPDMAYSKFTNSILNEKPVNIYGEDGGYRTMTHIDAAVTQIIGLIRYLKNSQFSANLGFETFNIGSPNSITALEMGDLISKIVHKKAVYSFVKRPSGDAIATSADLEKIKRYIGAFETRDIADDFKSYVDWHTKNLNLFPKS